MKTKFTLLCLWFSSLIFSNIIVQAQTIQSPGISVNNNLWPRQAKVVRGGLGKTSTCAPDTVNYVWNKTTVLSTISLNNVSSGNAFAQWYPTPQAMNVSGFEFYAWQIAGTSAIVPLTCRIYNAGTDSMPTGSPLASVTVNVDSTFGSGLLSTLRKLAIFPSGVTVSNTNGYVITVESSSSVSVAVVTNSWTASPANGRSEWCSSVRIGSTYYRSYNINVGGVAFNADFLLQPFVSYNLNANFSSSMSCMSVGTAANFTNTSSAVLFNRFYNVRAFLGFPQFSCIWDYGDTTGQYYSVNGTRTYNYNATYKVQLQDTLYGWTTGCSDYFFRFINANPVLNSATNNGPVCAGGVLRLNTDSIPGASYSWSGPNSFTSSIRNPVITPAGSSAAGVYNVQATLSTCTSSPVGTTVTVISSYNASNNSPLCSGQTLSLMATQIPGATYSWTGPNGFTSTIYNPNRVSVGKADSGVYSVTITTTGCGVIGPLTTLVIVNDIPSTPSISSNSPLCLGSNLNLSASGPTGNYFWSGPGGYTSNIQNPIRLSATSAYSGTYTVTVTANGCTSAQASTNVVVNSIPSAPTAGNNGPLCTSQTLSLSATLIPNASYQWTGPNNFNSSSQNPSRTSITVSDAGTYSVYATVNGCASPVATTVVAITSNTPAPTVTGNGPLCPGQNLQLTASAVPGATYSWTGPKSFTSTLQNPIINNVNDSNAGLYSVTATTSACELPMPPHIILW